MRPEACQVSEFLLHRCASTALSVTPHDPRRIAPPSSAVSSEREPPDIPASMVSDDRSTRRTLCPPERRGRSAPDPSVPEGKPQGRSRRGGELRSQVWWTQRPES